MQTEEEQIAQIKDWWQRNGKPLLTGGVLALAVVIGWQGWQNYQANQAQGASALYQQLLESSLPQTGQVDPAKVSELAEKLNSEYAGTHYAQYGSLFVAKVAVEAGKLDDAATELKAVLDKPVDANLGELARQRLARVLAAQGKLEEGLKLWKGMPIRCTWPAAKNSKVICWFSWARPTRRVPPTRKPRPRWPRMPLSVVCR